MSPSLLPAAIDALVTLLRPLPELEGMQVFDGPEAKWPQSEFIAIGLSPEDLQVDVTEAAAGLDSRAQSTSINCLVRSWTGDTDISARRQRAYAVLDIVRAELEADPTLGGAVDRAEITASVYAPAQTRQGVIADVVFVVLAQKY